MIVQTTNDLVALIEGGLAETGRDLESSAFVVRQEVATQLSLLALAAGEPGYERAVRVAARSVALRAGISVTEDADAVDARLWGIVYAGLFFGARVAGGKA